MADTLEVLVGFGVLAAAMGGLLALRTHFRYRPIQRMPTKQQTESERLKELLAKTSTIGPLYRAYQKDGRYQTADGKTIDAHILAREALEVDPTQSLRDPDYVKNLLKHIQESGQQAGARYFSLSVPADINRNLAYSLALLSERKN